MNRMELKMKIENENMRSVNNHLIGIDESGKFWCMDMNGNETMHDTEADAVEFAMTSAS